MIYLVNKPNSTYDKKLVVCDCYKHHMLFSLLSTLDNALYFVRVIMVISHIRIHIHILISVNLHMRCRTSLHCVKVQPPFITPSSNGNPVFFFVFFQKKKKLLVLHKIN